MPPRTSSHPRRVARNYSAKPLASSSAFWKLRILCGDTRSLCCITKVFCWTQQTLVLIEDAKHLQTDDMMSQVTKVRDISEELNHFLERLGRVRKRHIASQYLRAFGTNRQDERELAGILDRLDRARSELLIRIQLAHVSVTASIHDKFARINSNMDVGLGAAPLACSYPSSPLLRVDSGYEEDPFSFGDVEPPNTTSLNSSVMGRPSKSRSARRYIGSQTFDRAMIISGDVGAGAHTTDGAWTEYRNCEASGDSLQVHGGVDLVSFRRLLALRG